MIFITITWNITTKNHNVFNIQIKNHKIIFILLLEILLQIIIINVFNIQIKNYKIIFILFNINTLIIYIYLKNHQITWFDQIFHAIVLDLILIHNEILQVYTLSYLNHAQKKTFLSIHINLLFYITIKKNV
jgi:hypothetical protein